MNTYWGNGNIAPRILRPQQYMEVSGHLHVPTALPPGKELSVPVGMVAGWGPEPEWTWCRREFPSPVGNRTPIIRSSNP